MFIDRADLTRDKVAKLAKKRLLVIARWPYTYTDENWDVLAEVIRTTTSLEKLVFHQSGTAIALQHDKVIDALANNRTIKSLDLWEAFGGDAEAKAVAAILKETSTIEAVNLHGNNIKREGAKAIADALKHNKTLRHIDLDTNQIGVEGAKAIADALKVNHSSLRQLYIGRNNIGEEGGEDILNALQEIEISAIETINLNHNKVSYRTQAKIEREMIRIKKRNAMETTIREQQRTIAEQQAELAQKDGDIAKKDKEIATVMMERSQTTRKIAELHSAIAQLHDELAQKQDEIASLTLRNQRLKDLDVGSEDLENYTKCCVCLEPYDEGLTSTDNQRLPIKSATCAHSLCEGCLDNYHASLMNGRSTLRYVRCPQCNDKTKKAFDIQNKVVDLFLREYIHCRKRKRLT
jgi:Ran GTPase-activating protein (RanGAP) involved in mRNA processing and transport